MTASADTPRTAAVFTLCGNCSHPMHWHECGVGADLTAGPCGCRNDTAIQATYICAGHRVPDSGGIVNAEVAYHTAESPEDLDAACRQPSRSSHDR